MTLQVTHDMISKPQYLFAIFQPHSAA